MSPGRSSDVARKPLFCCNPFASPYIFNHALFLEILSVPQVSEASHAWGRRLQPNITQFRVLNSLKIAHPLQNMSLQLQGGPQTFVGGLQCLGEAGACTHSSVLGGTQLSPNPLGTQRTCSLQDTSDGIIWPQQITGKVATIAHAPWSRISGPQSFKTQVLPF